MKTVSVETAKKLRSAGLEWEPKAGDWFTYGDQDIPCLASLIHFQSSAAQKYISISDEKLPEGRLMTVEQLLKENAYWLPTLGDLLEWLEEQGYATDISDRYCMLHDEKGEGEEVYYKYELGSGYIEPLAKAVLWALEKGAGQ